VKTPLIYYQQVSPLDAPAIRICALLLSGQAPEFTQLPVGALNKRRASVWLRKEVLEKGHIVAPSQTLPDAMGNWTLRRGSRTRRANSSLSISAGKFISVKSTLMSKRAFSAS
jgi:hypothetical protein